MAHAKELGNDVPEEPVIFMKPKSALLQSHTPFYYPEFTNELHYECELVLLIGQDADGDTPDEITSIIAAYGVGLDLTARDVQSQLKAKGLPWTKAKGFRGAACVSDFVAASALSNPQDCTFSLHINGVLRQQGQTSHMIYPLAAILQELATNYGLKAGDVVFTGTPAGVGELYAGDVLQLDLAQLVQAQFTVAARA